MDYKTYDPDLWNAIAREEERQENNLELIACRVKSSYGCPRKYFNE